MRLENSISLLFSYNEIPQYRNFWICNLCGTRMIIEAKEEGYKECAWEGSFSKTSFMMGTTTREKFIMDKTQFNVFKAQADEILKYKWLESEKIGHDIGEYEAARQWISKYAKAYRLQLLEKWGI